MDFAKVSQRFFHILSPSWHAPTENSSGNVENLQRNDPFAELTANQHLEDSSSPDVDRQLENGGEEFNRLVFESSPYLLQHARNPIDCLPGRRGNCFAKKEDKPVFLSIDSTTRHWCHAMERESQDEKVAEP